MLRNLIPLFLVGLLSACQVGPREIVYGQDACEFCKMTIVDERHAAQLVSKKGKNYVFDAIECMVQYRQENVGPYEHELVVDYMKPGHLIPAQHAHFLISPKIPSPMGAFLSAFSDLQQLEGLAGASEGKMYDWSRVQSHILQK